MSRSAKLALVALVSGLATAASAQPNFVRVTVGDVATARTNSPGAAWVDFDGDDDLDLFVATLTVTPNLIYENDGEGNLTQAAVGPVTTEARGSRGLCWADFDNNGALDLFVTGSGGQPMLYRNDGGGDLQPVDLQTTFGVLDLRGWTCTWGDYDLDGFVDLVITHPAGFAGAPTTSNHFFRNRGDGTFEAVTNSPITQGFAPYTVPTFSDFDQDGDLDLFIGAGPATGTPGPDFLYRNLLKETGTAQFERITDGPIATMNRDGQVINWIDYDNDGDLDAYITNWGGLNNGTRDELFLAENGSLVAVEEGAIVTDKQVSLASVWGDFDNDGDLDVFVTDGAGNRANRLYNNNGDGTFTRIISDPSVSDVGVSWGATIGDYDGDGDLDLFVANVNNGSLATTANFLYRNDLDNGNHWMRIKLVGTTSNRAGIGAKVRAKATIGGADVWQLREVSSQNSFNGQNSLFVHFGLGDTNAVDSLVVEWPSGQTDVFEDVAADRFLSLTEGESPGVVAAETDLPDHHEVTLETNFPNPFRDMTSISFYIPESSQVKLDVFDTVGRLVSTPLDGWLAGGRHLLPVSLAGQPAGVYVIRLRSGNARQTRIVTHTR